MNLFSIIERFVYRIEFRICQIDCLQLKNTQFEVHHIALQDIELLLPLIQEFDSSNLVINVSSSQIISCIKFRNYTSPSSSSKAINSSEVVPLLSPINSRSRERDRSRSNVKDELVQQSSATKKLSMNNSKVAPIISKATLISKSNLSQAASVKPSSSSLGFKPYTVSSALNTSKSSSTTQKIVSSTPSKDNKKNDEKLRQKAEKEAKKEEKRLTKEAEKIAKTRAKEMKKQKCSSGESKALLVS